MVGWHRHLNSLIRQVGKTLQRNHTQAAAFSSSSRLEAGLPYLQRLCSRQSSTTIPRPLHHYFQQLGISSSRNLLAEEPVSSPLTPLLTPTTAKTEGHSQKSLTKPATVQAILKKIKQLQVTVKRAAKTVYQVIHSARANATHNHGLDPDRLLVAEAFVGKGNYKKRVSIHGRGKSGIIMRPECRLTVVVREITPEEEAQIAKLKVKNFVKLNKRERRLVPHQLIETTSIWGRKGKGRNHELNGVAA